MTETYAVIVAAGRSTRMGEMDKQLLEIAGMPVLLRTLGTFENSPSVKGAVLVVAPEKMEQYTGIVSGWQLKKLLSIVPGGAQRQQSVYSGLLALPFSCGTVLVHDGARPLVTVDDIEAVAAAAGEYGAATLAVPVKDTVKVAAPDGFVAGTPDRSTLWHTQTPQGFSYSLLIDAHKSYTPAEFATDDASMVERLGYRVRLVAGSYRNIKITTPEDVPVAEALLRG